ncbi:MAG: hypothetical protein Q9227_009565 [Pyrenula ochraceoflavens]
MGPKGQKSATGKSKAADEDREESLQAVVLADTFETRFAPFSLERPRCLLPLANVPLIEYTLEYLANAGAQDVFIYAGSHTDQVESYIATSKWKLSTSPFKTVVFLKAQAASVGDVMRDLDSKNFITGDFLAVSGDIVSNFPIEGALAKHRSRRQKNKNAIMTMLLRETDPRPEGDSTPAFPVFVIEPSTERCLWYQEFSERKSTDISLEDEILSAHKEIDLRQDLLDCRIDICTPDVLSLWTDNFDNQSPRKDFLFGVLKDYELNGKTIHVHIIEDHYSSRAGNLQAYTAVSRDIKSGLAYPLKPDTNLLPNYTYQLRSSGVYQENGVILARSCTVGSESILGLDTSIGDRSTVSNSIIGRRCLIGKNVTIENAYIWDDSVIGDGSRVEGCIIANEVVVGEDCNIEAGSLLSYGVRLGKGTHVARGTSLTTIPSTTEDDESRVGKGGHGHVYVEDDETGHEHLSSSSLFYEAPSATSSVSSLVSEASSTSAGALAEHENGSRSQSFSTSIDGEDSLDSFHSEAVASVFARMQFNTEPEDVRVELMGLRFSNNATEYQVRKAIAVALMKHIQSLLESKTSAADVAVKEALGRYKTLVQRENEDAGLESQVEFMVLAQQDLARRRDGERILVFLARQLYEDEVFGEDVFEDWWNDPRSSADEDMEKVRVSTKPFIDWLATAEEEESESDSEATLN